MLQKVLIILHKLSDQPLGWVSQISKFSYQAGWWENANLAIYLYNLGVFDVVCFVLNVVSKWLKWRNSGNFEDNQSPNLQNKSSEGCLKPSSPKALKPSNPQALKL